MGSRRNAIPAQRTPVKIDADGDAYACVMGDATKTFGDYIREGRRKKGLSQEELESQSAVSRSTLSRWERNQLADPPTPEHVRKVCAILGLDPIRAAVLLGYLKPEEVETTRPHLPPDIEEMLAALQDPALSDQERAELRAYLKVRLNIARQRAV